MQFGEETGCGSWTLEVLSDSMNTKPPLGDKLKTRAGW